MVRDLQTSIGKQARLRARARRGLFSISHLATSLFLTVTLVCVLNMGGVEVDRSNQQRVADSTADTLGQFKARNINAVVSHQHLMGELLSVAVIHHAIGGELLDKNEAADTRRRDQELRTAHKAALACTTKPPFAFEDVVSPVHAGEALLKAHKRLKQLLTYVYYTKATAAALMAFPPTRPAGEALAQIADKMERMIHEEWKTLGQIWKQARSLSPLKLQILSEFLPSAKDHLDRLVQQYPIAQRELADQMEKKYGVKIHVLPSDRRLPLKKDPLAELNVPPSDWERPECDCPAEVEVTNLREQLAKVSQLSRAMFPWVNYHREGLVRKMKSMLWLSRMGTYYFDHTAGVAKRMADELQRPGAGSLALYVLDDYEGPDKAYESWIESGNSGDADKTFGLTVLVGIPQRPRAADKMFRAQPTSLAFRVASSIAWNRHEPKQREQRIDFYCKRIVPSTQAATGWDTLNWGQGIKVSELVGIGIPHVFPKITPQWTSQLTPTSGARVIQLRQQALPDWGQEYSSVVPAQMTPELVGI